MNASILAVGTELTTGQIVNKNATWISEKLKPYGITVCSHLTIPDDRQAILSSLDYLSTLSEVIFVTGGLGPTSDDFTRELIAEWSQQKLTFHEPSWKQIEDRLKPRGFSVQEIQRQQCFFPEKAKVLTNSQGTANGFYLEVTKDRKKTEFFVLPGPPKEIAAIWEDHLISWLSEKTKAIKKSRTQAWDTLGVGESDVALRIEKVLGKFPNDVKLDVGYRVHLPYVEVKLTYFLHDQEKLQNLLNEVDQVLKDITVVKDFADLAQLTVKKIAGADFTFYDLVTTGFLHFRLSPYLKGLQRWSWKQSDQQLTADFFEHEENFVAVLPYSDNQCLVVCELNGERRQKIFEAPMKSALMHERRLQYYAEMALAFLSHIKT